MIFNTITEGLNNAINNKIGIFNRSFADLKNAISSNGIKGLFNSISPAITSYDLSLIKEYNHLVGVEGVSSQSAWYRTMLSSSRSAQALFNDENNLIRTNNGLILSEEALAKITNTMTIGAKAGKVALQALATVGNMIAMWGITEVISVIYSCATASDRLKESANSLGSTFSSTKSDIEGYKAKINDLYKTINDSSSSYEDTYNARQKLLTIQNEMIEKFGSEAEAVQLVTDAINGHNEALDSLTKQKWQETVNSFNYDPNKKWTERVGDGWANLWSESSNNFDRMINEMENTEVSFRLSPQFKNEIYTAFIKKLEENFDASLINNQYDDTVVTLSGNLDDIYDQLLNIQSLARDMGIDDSFLSELSHQAEKAKNTLDNYQEIYNQHILYDKILDNDTYEQYFINITNAYKKYQEAFSSGDEESISKAKQNFAEIVQTATEGTNDKSIIDYFNNMYPDLQAIVGAWEFEVNFKASIDDENNDFENKVKNALNNFENTDDIFNYNSKIATQEQIDAYALLNSIADEYNLTLDELIHKMSQMGLISSQVKDDLLHKLTFKVPNNNNLTFGSGIQSVLGDIINIDTDVVSEWVNSLTEEEAKLANSSAFNEALERQKENLDGAALSAENYSAALEEVKAQKNGISTDENPISSLSISDTIDHLNTQLKPAFDSLKSAYQDIFTDNGTFALNSINILSTCDSIKSRLDEMSKSGLNVDYSSYEDFVRVLRNSESTGKNVEDAFNSLATSITRAALSGAEDLETMKAALEDLGVVNNEMVAFEALISNTEALKEAGLDLEAVSQMEESQADAVIRAFASEAVSAENLEQAINLLKIQKILCNENWINSSKDINDLYVLALAAGIATDAISKLSGLKNEYDTAVANNETVLAKAIQSEINMVKGQVENQFAGLAETSLDFSNLGGGQSAAGHSGQATGSSYVDAFEQELDKLKTSRDQGKITEKQYLDYLRKLYQHFFRDKKKYAEEYAKYENEYLQGMKSLYESALSGITSLLDKQIDSYEDSKSAAVDSLEAERDARIEVLEAQKEQYEEQIKLIDKQIKDKESLIDNINDEIDAIRDANEERQRQLTLREKQIALERMLNQRTILQYSDDKGMHYVQDTDGIRSAKQELDDAQTEIEIADKEKQIKLIEKEIDLLEERKDSINEQIDLIDTQIDQINAQYDKMIADTEKYWDNLISGMENYKSRWQELAEIEEQAKLISTLEQLGISANDILNMSETTFSKFKDEYIGILADIYSENDSMLSSLADSTGRSIGEMGSYLESTQGYINNLSGIGESLNPVSEAISNVDGSMNALASSASAVNEETSGITSNMGELDGYAEGVSANLSDISTTLTAFPDAEKFNAIAEAFRNLAEALNYVSQVLGAEDPEGQGGIASQFSNLKNAIDQVSAAISGGQSSASGDDKNGSSKSIGHKGGGNSLTKALSSLSETVGSVIGEPEAEGDGTVIGGFGSLKTAVNEVSSAIGSGDSENEEKSDTGGEENEGNLTASITGLRTTTEDTLGKPGGEGVIGRFEQFKNVLDEASQHVQSIPKGLEDINGKTVECTIKVNIESNGSLPSVLNSSMQLYSKHHNAKYEGSANATGTALVTGNWAVQSAEKHTLMGELGRELIVRRGRFFTVGNYGAEFVDIQKGDIVFNHRQTEQLLKNGHISGRGKAYADGTVGSPLASGKYTPIGQDSRTWELLKAFDPLVQKLLNGEEQLINNAFSNEQAQMDKLIKDMAATNIVSKNLQPDIHVNDINITCPGVTSREVAKQVGAELNHMFNGLHNYADQQSMIR